MHKWAIGVSSEEDRYPESVLLGLLIDIFWSIEPWIAVFFLGKNAKNYDGLLYFA